jgi:hypothetical protein
MENLANVFEAVKPKMTKKKRIDKIGNKIVYLVDGDYIRDYIDIQFTNVGQHWRFNFIPPNEIWLDKNTNHSEWPFFIDHQIWERRMMKDYKMSYRKALEYADQRERDERHSAGGLAKDVKPRPNVDVDRKYWKKVGDAKVYLVSGKKVRQGYYLDFTGGGHGYVYGFIPKDEVWIEKEVKAEKEKSFDLIHEITERDQMKLGMGYNKAHDHASKVENLARHAKETT